MIKPRRIFNRCVSTRNPMQTTSGDRCLPAVLRLSAANVWNLIGKRLSHPATVRELTVCRLGGGGLLSSF